MSPALRTGSVLGLIAAFIILLFGGWSGVFVGVILAALAGMQAAQQEPLSSARQGWRLGFQAGLGVGLVGFMATLIEAQLLLPIAGQSALSWGETALFGGAVLILSIVAGLAMGSVQSLQGSKLLPVNLWVLLAFALLYPWLDGGLGLGWLGTSIQILIFAMLALGLNITVGYAGLLDLGYAAFFAIGAYTTGFLASPHLGIEWNFWIVIWLAAAVAALAGILLGTPTLPLRGDYLAIVTLGFGEIVPIIFRNLTRVQLFEPISSLVATISGDPSLAICLLGCTRRLNLTGGEAGINPIGRPSLPIIGNFESGNDLPWYYLILALVILAVFAINRLRNSRIGRAWAAMREDELAASTMGINLVATKLTAFSMGATFSGFAGAFYASYIRAIFPTVFDFSVSVIILCMVILGGLGNMAGVLVGCLLIMGADRLVLPQLAEVLKNILNASVLPNITDPAWKTFLSVSLDPIQLRLFLFGLTLVTMMLVRPEGLIPSSTRQAEIRPKVEDPVPATLVESAVEP